ALTLAGNGAGVTALNPANLSPGSAGINITGNAGSATNFSGMLSGDVTGTQSATSISRLQGIAVTAAAPADQQVLQYNAAALRWQPATISVSGGGVSAVNASAPLSSSGGSTPSISLS